MGTTEKKIRLGARKVLKNLARPEGFEPPTLSSEVGLHAGPACNQKETGAENH